MKIESTSLSMAASYESLVRHERSESLRSWRGNPPSEAASSGARTNNMQLSISQSARSALALDIQAMGSRQAALPAAPTAPSSNDSNGSSLAAAIEASEETIRNDPFLSMIRSMVEFLTGRPLKTFSAADLRAAGAEEIMPAARTTAARNTPPPANFGMEYERHEVYEEFESASFSAEGMVRTADGQEIRFSLELQMERHYREESHVSLRAGNAVRKDPLVINFGGTAAQLLDQHFRFDLDGDGRAEELPMLASGSGYLAFDRNGNGRIDNGSELFGPATDNGFAELALLDGDGNGWIDENDPLFSRLGIWRPEADGAGVLSPLSESGIGALGLAHLQTPFELRGAGNSNLGAVRASGIALTENGQVFSMQEIDLTVA